MKNKVFKFFSRIINRLRRRFDPFYFDPSGFSVFCGEQGSGRSIHMIERFRGEENEKI